MILLESDPRLLQAYLAVKQNQEDVSKTFDDRAKFIPASKKYVESMACFRFLLPLEKSQKYQQIFMKKMGTPKEREFHKKDFAMILDRSTRQAIYTEYNNTPMNDRHKFCNEKLPTDLVDKINTEKEKTESEIKLKADKAYVKSEFNELHPLIRKIFHRLQRQIKEQAPQISDREVDFKVIQMYLKNIMPTMDGIAQLGINNLEKKCPGKTEEMWMACKGKQYFNNPAGEKLNPHTTKFLCLMDNKADLIPACADDDLLNWDRIKK